MKSILYIGNKLSRHGFTKGVIETLGPQLEGEGYTLRYAGTKKSIFLRLLEMISAIFRHGRKTDYVLIDTYSSTAFWYAWISGVLCRLMQIKYIHILHGGELPLRIKKSRWFCNQIFPQAYANVAVSGYLKSAFDQVGYPAIVIPNNIEIENYPFKQRKVIRPKLLWVRSFHRQYNPNMAADVVALLLKDYPDALLCMVGPDKDGSMQEFRDYCNQLGISEQVKITGLLSKSDWHALSQDYDIFINTTNVDNTPVSVIEAMALGLPVISTNVGGVPYLLEHNVDSRLVELNCSNEMAEQVTNLIKNSSSAIEISKRARKKAESFDWENIRLLWNKLLKDEVV